MDGMPKQIWANVAIFGNGEPLAGEWNYRDVGLPDDTPYIRADLAQAPAPVLWTQAQQLVFARAYDTEDAAHRGEPTPWFDEEEEWVNERVACVRAGLAALEAPDAGVVAELVEALRDIADEAYVTVKANDKGIDYKHLYEGWRKIATTRVDIARAALAKLGVR